MMHWIEIPLRDSQHSRMDCDTPIGLISIQWYAANDEMGYRVSIEGRYLMHCESLPYAKEKVYRHLCHVSADLIKFLHESNNAL